MKDIYLPPSQNSGAVPAPPKPSDRSENWFSRKRTLGCLEGTR